MLVQNATQIMTLDEFTVHQLRLFPHATGELSHLLRDIGLAAKRISADAIKAGLVGVLGEAGLRNVQGEDVKKLDVLANEQLIAALRKGVSCAGVGSEESDQVLIFDDHKSNQSKYVVLFDPLDGSSNIDNNISVGTIFGVYRRTTAPGSPATDADFLQPGTRQVAAGYVLYGTSTMLVYGTRRGVNGFTLDPAIGEFCLSHPDITCPSNGNTYSINHGNFFQYPAGVRHYITDIQRWNEFNPDSYTERYVGSMVADLHRTLLKGGLFLYPGTKERPEGKLRLLYECNPFAFLFEVAGGLATSGPSRILDIIPTKLHQRTPLFIGSKEMVTEVSSYL
ncbi:class 1 fructose-bisphosphatase [Dinghuibacter silviterrae]|uniref:Fructose-1,6-bisphosphatase class 1 n=1 Tax=Dinghuibacter silviterrae TaxID=1539049 RepID=A0A4R8DGY4_9BACT|nr:class 1 fructose-bisphosphatase [Dinghuibacter silviterrae]TDW96943.1 D-fructose 1,6-bisphosphatase [Dinghuibacter silviterrae]